ncbi:PREDICTED: tripartite motif-containing protein 2-like [Amphimedon queenslandica]|uniref:RING-type domain-containing protein n=1 Tax=Amphimedon queenslandica TaxID=400682 RepID=A0AAN0J906_AMPQE|nr:PREDICTED: tripartite motif-containing protein 2-like [Amphimedon queenslandica]|eukprot:XP_019853515.1 PREDICTED: tripartite motif-containing protein 2-like [Amphimedon queenslandica]
MAAKPSSGLRLKLEERLTCPVCLGHYTNPKILPCHHSFCQHCLEGLPLDKKSEIYYFFCPTCRRRTKLPEKGVGAFPVAFHLNDLKEMYSLTKKTADLQEAMCNDHGKPLELFCERCDTVICLHCSVRNHRGHECDLIADSYTKHCQKLKECLIPSERKLTEQVKKVTDDKLKVLSEQIKSAEMSLSLLEDVEEYVNQSIKTSNYEQVLRSRKQMMEHMIEVTGGINVEELHPKERADFVLTKDIKLLHHIGDIVPLQQCRVKKIGRITTAGKAVLFSLSMEAPDSSLLSVRTVPLSSLSLKVQVYDVHLEDISLVIPINPYFDNITPVRTITGLNRPWGVAVTDDDHVLITEYGGDCVTKLDREGMKVKLIRGKGRSSSAIISSHCGAADKFSDNDFRIQRMSMDGWIPYISCQGLVYIADNANHSIQKFSAEGKFVSQFGTCGFGPGQLNSPYVFTSDGVFVNRFGRPGGSIGQFKGLYGLALDKNGFLYVCDWKNNRLVVY